PGMPSRTTCGRLATSHTCGSISIPTAGSDACACSAGHAEATAKSAEIAEKNVFSLRTLRALRLMFCDMRLEDVNALAQASAAPTLRRCCGSSRWAQAVVRARRFSSVAAMMDLGDAVWVSLDAADWCEAFAAHPRIGEPVSPKRADIDSSGGGPAGVGSSE